MRHLRNGDLKLSNGGIRRHLNSNKNGVSTEEVALRRFRPSVAPRHPDLDLDGAEGDGCRRCAWKTELQAQVANGFGITLTVSHYPTGASKWIPLVLDRHLNDARPWLLRG